MTTSLPPAGSGPQNATVSRACACHPNTACRHCGPLPPPRLRENTAPKLGRGVTLEDLGVDPDMVV